MKPGDLVALRDSSKVFGLADNSVPESPGIVIDIIEDEVGYEHALVLFTTGRWWIFKSQLEAIDER